MNFEAKYTQSFKFGVAPYHLCGLKLTSWKCSFFYLQNGNNNTSKSGLENGMTIGN